MSNIGNDFCNEYLRDSGEWIEGQERMISANGTCFPMSVITWKISATTQHPDGLPVGGIFLFFHLYSRAKTYVSCY